MLYIALQEGPTGSNLNEMLQPLAVQQIRIRWQTNRLATIGRPTGLTPVGGSVRNLTAERVRWRGGAGLVRVAAHTLET